MNYIAEINGFERWLETHSLPTLSQLLWYKLVYLSSRAGWPEWMQVDNRRLMVSLQIAREASLTESRDRLVNAGLVEYQKGKKGIPGRYRLISLCGRNTTEYTYNLKVQPEVYSVVQPEVYSVVQSGDIINNKNKQKQQKSSTDVLPEKTDAFSDQITTIRELYNSVCGSYPRLVKMSEARKKAVRARLRAGYTVEDFRRLFEMAEASSFLKGQNNRNWTATFDWLIADANMAKVLDGNYKDKPQSSPYSSAKDAETAAWSKHRDYYGRVKNRFHNCESHGYDYEDILEQMGGIYEAENTEEQPGGDQPYLGRETGADSQTSERGWGADYQKGGPGSGDDTQ